MARGLYNPQTKHGSIIVNNILAGTYTTAVAPGLVHAVLAPLRAFSRTGVVDDPSFKLIDGGAGWVDHYRRASGSS